MKRITLTFLLLFTILNLCSIRLAAYQLTSLGLPLPFYGERLITGTTSVGSVHSFLPLYFFADLLIALALSVAIVQILKRNRKST
jgi:hypothetical protein